MDVHLNSVSLVLNQSMSKFFMRRDLRPLPLTTIDERSSSPLHVDIDTPCEMKECGYPSIMYCTYCRIPFCEKHLDLQVHKCYATGFQTRTQCISATCILLILLVCFMNALLDQP